MKFFIAQVGEFSQRKYAWFDVTGDATYDKQPKQCPACGVDFGRLPWLAPYNVELRQSTKVGDIVFGAGGADYLVSRRFYDRCCELDFTGLDRIYDPINIANMGTTKKSNARPKPDLVGVDFVIAPTLVDESKMSLEYELRSDLQPCSTCHAEKEFIKYDRIVIRSNTWNGHDFFFSTMMLSTLFLSERAAALIVDEGFTNFAPVPIGSMSWVTPTYDVIPSDQRLSAL